MTRAGLCVIAGLTGIAVMTAADASAQECPGWLKWACADSASSDAAVSERSRHERQLSQTTATSGSATGRRSKQARPAVNAAAQQAPARPAKAARHARGGDASGDRRPAPHAERQTRLDPAMNDQEKEALFREFLAWRKTRQLSAEINR